MTNLHDVLTKIAEDKELTKTVTAATDEFESKPFALEHRQTYKTVMIIRFFPSLISIIGASLAFSTIAPTLPLWASLSVGLALGLAFEALKNWLSVIGFRHYFKYGKGVIVAVAVLCYLLSIVSSTWGTYKGYQLVKDLKTSQTTGLHKQGLDSLISHHDGVIQMAKDRLARFEDQVTIRSGTSKGLIGWTSRDQHESLNNALSKAIDSKEAAIAAYTPTLSSQITETQTALTPFLYVSIGVALLVELLIFFMARFMVFYRYMAAKQVHDIATLNGSELVDLTLENMAHMVQGMSRNSVQFIPRIAAESETADKALDTMPGHGGLGFQIGSQAAESKKSDTPADKRPTTNGNRKPKGKQRGGLDARQCDHCKDWYYPYNVPQRFCSKDCNHTYHGFTLKK